MKKILLPVIIFSTILQTSSQTESCYCYAEGNNQMVTITWDLFSPYPDNEIYGCNIYKRISWDDPLVKINEELITSPDSNYFFVDAGIFIDTIPPSYFIEAVTNFDTAIVTDCQACMLIDFEVIEPGSVILSALPWDTVICFGAVNVIRNGELIVSFSYDSVMVCDLSYMGPGDVVIIEFLSEYGIYQSLMVRYAFIWNISHTVGIIGNTDEVTLNQNFPNPFKDHTTIGIKLFRESLVKLEIFELSGRLVHEAMEQILLPGNYFYTFRRGNFNSGIYIYRLTTDNSITERKMIILN